MVTEAAAATTTAAFSTPPPPISLRVSVVPIPGEEEGVEGLRTLVEGGGGEGEVLVAVGGGGAVRMARVVGLGMDRPVLGYVRHHSWGGSDEPLGAEAYLSANADPEIHGSALALLIGQFNLPNTHVLIQDTFLASGFLEGCRDRQEPSLRKSVMTSHMTDKDIRGVGFHLLNLVTTTTTTKHQSGEDQDERIWERVGTLSAYGDTDPRWTKWREKTAWTTFRTSDEASVRTYRVVTRPAKPFVFVEGPVSAGEECLMDVPCLMMTSPPGHNASSYISKGQVEDSVEDFLHSSGLHRGHEGSEKEYQVFCCKGLSMDVLKRLSEDLAFQYVIYFVNDSNYGEVINNSWTGMVGDVISGAADLIVGAFSMTSSRMEVISYTEPFYHNEFAMVSGEDGQSRSIWAFFKPFSVQVWTCILLSSVVAGVATSFLEWRSPFGLNPRGRQRSRQYGLGSGLLMVWVLVTGHTINVKAPKSWPSKVIQNVWAGLAIFIMTSYTANLAAYLAGQSAVIGVTTVHDYTVAAEEGVPDPPQCRRLLQKRVFLIPPVS
ncbi:hypothetical protein ACOMHN_004283 [Nucella lapillus]